VTVATQWRRTLSRLRAENPGALDLLSCLCFFGRAPIPREALERGNHLNNASIHPLLRDPIRRQHAIMVLRRAGLLREDHEGQTLQVHPVTRYIARDTAMRAGQARVDEIRHDTHLLLTAIDPLDPDNPANWPRYEQLRLHAADTDIEACSDDAVRRLLINLVHFLNAAGEPHVALSMADSAIRRWMPDRDEEPAVAYGCYLAMRRVKADALFACMRHQEAFQFQQETLELIRSAPGDWDDEIVLLGRLPGACYRMQGRFQDALEADVESRASHERKFGREHPHSFAVTAAVILDLALTGRSAEAVLEARQASIDCLAFYNDFTHPMALFQRNILARCLWLDRQYSDAVSLMADVHAGYRTLADEGILHMDHPWRLMHEIDFAIVRRDSARAHKTDDSDINLDVLVVEIQDVHRRCWRALGANHPQTLAAAVALGSILRRIPGRRAEVIRMLAEVERRYESVLPGHPFSRSCADYLAMIRQQPARDEIPGAEAGEDLLDMDFTPLPITAG